MDFVSIDFFLFLIVVTIVNYSLPQGKRWIWLIIASGYFYLNWNPIYLLLLMLTIVATFTASSIGERYPKYRKYIFIAGGCVPLLSLLLFKYYGFINSNVARLLEHLHFHINLPEMNLFLPLGISFYTFTAIGYLIDIYKRKYLPEKNIFKLALFIGFFAQISSGPIPRGDLLLPQFNNPDELTYDNVMGGIRKMTWGFFMKLCVADRLALYVDAAFGNMDNHNGMTLLLASLAYTIQIYCDFAGYSLIAIGVAKLLGIRLMDNFRRPYFSKSIKEFWSRWHISLSTWFRDYLYIPLGGSRVSKKRNYFNLLVTFLVSGLWHGAAWNFLLWGGVHGVGQIGEKVVNKNDRKSVIPSFVKIFLCFLFVSFAWVFFRLENLENIHGFFAKLIFDPGIPFIDMTLVYGGLSFLLLFIKDFIDEYFPGICLMASPNFWISNISTGICIAFILLFGVMGGGSFIYFQF